MREQAPTRNAASASPHVTPSMWHHERIRNHSLASLSGWGHDRAARTRSRPIICTPCVRRPCMQALQCRAAHQS